MDLSVDNHDHDGRTVVTVTGEVDVYTAPMLRERLIEVMTSDAPQIIVDLSNVGFLDSTGLGVLVGSLKRARSAGGNLELVVSQEKILKVFRITGLTKVFTIYDSLNEVR